MALINRQRSVAINAPRICQPIGAIWASLGVHGAVPLVHGSQGCTTYPRNLMSYHFREPVDIATTSLHEKATIFGGKANLTEALKNLIARQNPELITVMTTCLTETIGDDIHGIVRDFKKDNKIDGRPRIVTINTPSYVGTHVVGYDNAVKALVSQIATQRTGVNGKPNIITGMLNPGDILEIKHILAAMGVQAIYLTDISETLNAPLRLPKPSSPKGGTTVEEIADCANSLGTIVLCKHEGRGAANYLKEKFGVPVCLGEIPVGVKNTEAFIDNVVKLTGRGIPSSLLDERDLLVDAMVDSHQHIFGTRVAIFGDPDIVLAIARFAYELGMQPVHVLTTLESEQFAADMQALAKEHESEPNIIVGGDLYDLHQKIKEDPVDLITGDSQGKYIAKEEKTPLIRVGFPQRDRFGYQRRSMTGFRGSLQLLDTMVNAILEARE